MKAEFTISANDVIRFDVEPYGIQPPQNLTYRHSCCPFGWGTIFELGLQRIDPKRNIAVYKILKSRSEKPGV